MLDAELMPTSAVATRLGVTSNTIIYLMKQGEITPMMKLPVVNGTYLFEPAEVERVAALRARKAASTK